MKAFHLLLAFAFLSACFVALADAIEPEYYMEESLPVTTIAERVEGGYDEPLTAEERRFVGSSLEVNQKGILDSLKKGVSKVGDAAKSAGNAIVKGAKAVAGAAAAIALKFASAAMGAVSAFSNSGLSLGDISSLLSGPQSAANKATTIEDCMACKLVWSQVEMDVGNSKIEEVIYTAFTRNCKEAQQAEIFYAACQDMFSSADDFVVDYLNGFSVEQMCENNRICRSVPLF